MCRTRPNPPHRWKILPAEEREGIKNYIVGKVVDISKDEASMQAEKLFLNKLNVILVQILKQVRRCLRLRLRLRLRCPDPRPSDPIQSSPTHHPMPPAHPNRTPPQEWPHNWPNFISDIVSFSQTSEVLCENNIRILKLLSEGAYLRARVDGLRSRTDQMPIEPTPMGTESN